LGHFGKRHIAINVFIYSVISNFLFMKCRWHEAVCFFFVHLRHVACGDAFIALGTKYCAVVFGKINHAVNYAVIVHFNKITLTNFLIIGNEGFAMRAANRQDMTATDFSAIWILIYSHDSPFERSRPVTKHKKLEQMLPFLGR